MNNITLSELKHIQLDVLEAIHNFCIDNNITYSISCGTLIGAVRHKGYIPWDDDIDIYLLRDDYKKLIDLFPQKYDDRYCIISLERDNKWDRPYAKAYNDETIFIESKNKSYQIGVGIDIFPIDKVPESNYQWENYNFFRKLYQYAISIKNMNYDRNRILVKNLLMLIIKFLLFPISTRVIAMKIDVYSQKFNHTSTNYIFESVQGLNIAKPFKLSIFSEMELVEFENNYFFAFKDYDEYLRNAYGDYMQLPPEDKRISHHSYTAYWKKK